MQLKKGDNIVIEKNINFFDSRERCKILLDKKGDFIFDINKTLNKYKKEIDLDAFSIGQLESKKWVVDILEYLDPNLGITFILCGWYAILSSMLFYSNLKIEKIRSFDKDETCYEIADSINKTNYNRSWKFKAIKEDILNIDFKSHKWQMWSNSNKRMCYPITDIPNTIINTSCEHTTDYWYDKIPEGKLVVLQSNNFTEIKEHVNCVFSIDEMIEKYKMNKIFFSGEKNFEKYSRYMLVGIK